MRLKFLRCKNFTQKAYKNSYFGPDLFSTFKDVNEPESKINKCFTSIIFL